MQITVSDVILIDQSPCMSLTLARGWANVCNAGPAMSQHWASDLRGRHSVRFDTSATSAFCKDADAARMLRQVSWHVSVRNPLGSTRFFLYSNISFLLSISHTLFKIRVGFILFLFDFSGDSKTSKNHHLHTRWPLVRKESFTSHEVLCVFNFDFWWHTCNPILPKAFEKLNLTPILEITTLLSICLILTFMYLMLLFLFESYNYTLYGVFFNGPQKLLDILNVNFSGQYITERVNEFVSGIGWLESQASIEIPPSDITGRQENLPRGTLVSGPRTCGHCR